MVDAQDLGKEAHPLHKQSSATLLEVVVQRRPERVARSGAVPPIPETRRYVEAVIGCYLALSAGRTAEGPRESGGRDAADK